MDNISDYPVYSKNVLEFLTVANDYCLTMDKLASTSVSNLTNYLQKVCPLLYLKASLLPVIKVQNPDANERFVTQEEWEILFNQIRLKFGDDDPFWFIDQTATHNDPVKSTISEYLTDIYQELKDFTILYQKSSLDAKENAVSSVRESFESHWGYSLVNVHKTLHYLIMRGQPHPDDELEELF